MLPHLTLHVHEEVNLMQRKDTKSLHVLEGALKLDKERDFSIVVQAQ
jgi:hypothetical protein